MSDNIRKSAYFCRIITLVVGVGTETLRDIFYSKVPKTDVSTIFSTPQITSEFKRLKGKVLTNVQYEHVTVNPDPDKYDITLLLVLLTNKKIFGISTPQIGKGASLDPADESLGADLIRLQEIRNDLVGHLHNTRLEVSEYKKYWGTVETILVRIAGSVSKVEEAKVKQEIIDAEKRLLEPLDDREDKLLQVFLQWWQEEDERNKAQLTDVQNSLASLHLKVDGIPKSSTSTDEVDGVPSENTHSLSWLQSLVSSIAQSMGMMAQQVAVQQIHQNVQNMQGVMSTLRQEVKMLQKQLEEKQEEYKRFMEDIAQLRQPSGEIFKSTSSSEMRHSNPMTREGKSFGGFISTEGRLETMQEARAKVAASNCICKINYPVKGGYGSGTGFRVGQKYIMTAAHVSNAFPEEIVYTDRSTDIAVLELEDHPRMPPAFIQFCPPVPCKEFSLIGHTKGEVMQIDNVTTVIDKDAPDTKRFLCQLQNMSIERTGRSYDSPPFDTPSNPDRIIFHCKFTKGASGSPGVVLVGETLYVITVLLHGYPDWYYDQSMDDFKSSWPKECCVEQGVDIQSVRKKMSETHPSLCQEIFGVGLK